MPNPLDGCSILVTPEEAACILHIGRSKMYELIAIGEVVSIKIGRCRRVETSELTAYVARLRQDQGHEGDRGQHRAAS